jgi:Tryptophan-rich Synechocystis species C-terminal domain
VQTASGYDVAWKLAGTDDFTVWATNSNGTFLSNLVSGTGTSSSIESIETLFNQDLNGDGHIGIPTTSQAASSFATINTTVSTPDNFHFTGTDGGVSGQAAGPHNHQDHAGKNTGHDSHDSFVFTPDHGSAGASNFVHPTDPMPFNNTAFTAAHATSTETHDDAFAHSAIHDGAHGAQWLVHHSGFHLA